MKRAKKHKKPEQSDVPGEVKLTGAMLSPEASNYLSMLAYANSTTKSDIVRDALHDFIRQSRVERSEESLVYEIARKVNRLWAVNKLSNKVKTAREFRTNMKDLLKKKGIDKSFVDLIFLKVHCK